MRVVANHESKYINPTGYWLALNRSAIDLRQGAVAEGKDEDALWYDLWEIIATRYGFQTMCLQTEIYLLTVVDPTYDKMVFPELESRGEMPASDDLDEPLCTLESHMTSQLMKVEANINVSNATKRNDGRNDGGRGRKGSPPMGIKKT